MWNAIGGLKVRKANEGANPGPYRTAIKMATGSARKQERRQKAKDARLVTGTTVNERWKL